QTFAQQTISEAIARGKSEPGRRPFFASDAEIGSLSFEELVRGSTMIVEAKLSSPRTYANARDDRLLTDFTIEPLRFYRGLVPTNVARPGAITPFVLSLVQGVIVREGVTVRSGVHGFEQMVPGKPYLLFVKPWGTETGHYQLQNYSAFEIVGNSIRPL